MLLVWTALLCCRLQTAGAHPVSQGAMEVTIARDAISLRARVSTEEVFVRTAFAPPAPGADGTLPSLEKSWPDHGRYLLPHVRIFADGRQLAGRRPEVVPPPPAGPK